MMVEIALQKLDQLVNVHSLLNKSKLSLQTSILSRLHKSKHSMLLLHPNESRVDPGPLFRVRLAESIAPCYYGFRLNAHLLLQHSYAFLLLIEALHVPHHILVALLLLLLDLLRVACLQLGKQSLQFSLVVEAEPIHPHDRVTYHDWRFPFKRWSCLLYHLVEELFVRVFLLLFIPLLFCFLHLHFWRRLHRLLI